MDKPDRSPPREQLWLAINEYVVACSGDPISRVYGNIYRQRAVAAIEAMLDAAPVPAPPAEPTREALDAMVYRFLAWPLPKDFAPDCGISFDGRGPDARGYDRGWPTGTNLFTAEQARAMFQHALAAPAVDPCGHRYEPHARGEARCIHCGHAVRYNADDAAPAAKPVAQQPPPCSPTLTVCPRCHNDVSKCDGIFAAQQPPPTLADADAHWLSCWSEDEMSRGNVSNGTRFVQIAARIESDAERIRALEAALRGVIREADRDTDAFIRARALIATPDSAASPTGGDHDRR